MWRLGMQCEGLVRDPIRLAALVLMNQAGWPSSLGMEAEAPREPYSDASVTDGRREKNGGGNAPTSGNQHGERPTEFVKKVRFIEMWAANRERCEKNEMRNRS
jgi:hypothetical protein